MDPERQQLLRPNQQHCEQVKIIYGADSIVFPSSLQGRVPPDRFYHTMKRLNEAYGPMSGRTKVFIITLILLFVGLLMPFAMMRWFTPRHFEVKVWIPIDGILIAVNLGLALLMYIRSRRIRSELAQIVKKENKVCYHKTGVHLRLEPGGVATRPCIYIELAQTTASDHAAYGLSQAPPPRATPLAAHHGPSRVPPPSRMPDSRLPSPPPFRQQHSFYELQQHNAPPTPQQAMPHQEFRSPPMSPRGGSGNQHRQPDQRQPSPTMSPHGGVNQHRRPDERQPSPPMSPRYYQHGGAPPPSNYAPPPVSSPPASYRPQLPPPSDGGAFQGSPQTGHLAVEFTSVPVRDPPSQGQYYDPTEGHYSPSPSPLPQKRSAAGGFNPAGSPPYSPSRQQQQPPPQQQQQYYERQQQQQQQQQPFYPPQGAPPRQQASSPRQGGPYGNQPHTAHRAI